MNKETLKLVFELYQDGLTTIEVGKKLNISQPHVWRVLNQLGVKCRKRGFKKGHSPWNKDLVGIMPVPHNKKDINDQILIDLYLQGESTITIGKKVGLSSVAVRLRLKNSGIKLRNKKEAKKIQFEKGRIPPQVLLRIQGKIKMFGKDHPGWTGGMHKCQDCGKQLNGYTAIRCETCMGKAMSGKNHPNYKTGKPHCKHCDKELRHYKNKTGSCFDCWLQFESIKTWSVRPTKPEKVIQALLDKHFPKEWKYVGNGKVWFGKKNPDFMNVNGQKKLIEVYGDYWHKGEDPQERINHFKQYGFDTLVIWENECYKDEKYLLKLMNSLIN